MKIDISKKDKAEVLVALYNASRPIGLGYLEYDPTPMRIEEARSLLERQTYFDYCKGRVMKVNLAGNELDTYLYNRDNGTGAAERVLSEIVDRY